MQQVVAIWRAVREMQVAGMGAHEFHLQVPEAQFMRLWEELQLDSLRLGTPLTWDFVMCRELRIHGMRITKL